MVIGAFQIQIIFQSFSSFLEMLEKFDLSQSFLRFSQGFIRPEPAAGFFGKHHVQTFDFLDHSFVILLYHFFANLFEAP